MLLGEQKHTGRGTPIRGPWWDIRLTGLWTEIQTLGFSAYTADHTTTTINVTVLPF
jgi:hypothetical protein